jgi:hypothetical protein
VGSEMCIRDRDELRSALGLEADSYEVELTALNDQIADALAEACPVERAGATPPTFREEGLTETIRSVYCRKQLWLSRAPVVSVASVVVDGTTLSADDYYVDGWKLLRLVGGSPADWSGAKIVVTYTAGWATVPTPLKLAATKLARILWTEEGPGARDPGLKRERIEGVIEREWWVTPGGTPMLPVEITDLLAPYRNYSL